MKTRFFLAFFIPFLWVSCQSTEHHRFPAESTSTALPSGWTTFVDGNSSHIVLSSEVLISSSLSFTELSPLVAEEGGTLLSSPSNGWWRVSFPETLSIENALLGFGSLSGVSQSEPQFAVSLSAVPNDPGYSQQWAFPDHNFEAAWDALPVASNSPVLAVVDTGVDTTHQDIVPIFSGGTDIVDGDSDPMEMSGSCPTGSSVNFGHGTWVSALAAGATDNALGTAGGAFNRSSLLSVRAFPPCGFASLSAVAQGIVWAVNNGADVVLAAFQTTADSHLLQDAVQYAWDHGVLIVSSAGNDSLPTTHYPAAYSQVLGVGATNGGGGLDKACPSPYTNTGSWIDVWAGGGVGGPPAGQVLSADWDGISPNLSGRKFGSSASAAFVAGAALLAIEAAPPHEGAQALLDRILAGTTDHSADAACGGLGVSTYLDALQSLSPDSQAPSLLQAIPTSRGTIELLFDERLDPGVAIDTGAWALSPDGWKLREVRMSPDLMRVTLHTWNLTTGTEYTVVAANTVTDMSGNMINPVANSAVWTAVNGDVNIVVDAFADGTGGTPANAVDGNESTFWAASTPTCLAVRVDMTDRLPVSRVRVRSGGSNWAATVWVGMREGGADEGSCLPALSKESFHFVGNISSDGSIGWHDMVPNRSLLMNTVYLEFTNTASAPIIYEVEAYAVNLAEKILVATGHNATATDSFYKIFETVGDEILSKRAWYWPNEVGQTHIAAGDVDGDGWDDIILGDGFGGSSFFKVFDSAGVEMARERPYFNGNNPRGELTVATGDPDGDGVEEIVACTGEWGAGSCSFFEFVPGNKQMRPETDLITTYYRPCANLDDGICDLSDEMPWGRYYSNEVHPAFADYDGDGEDEIVLVHGDAGRNRIDIKELCVAWDADSGIACGTRTRTALVTWFPYNLSNNPDGEVHIAVGHFTDSFDQIALAQGIGSAGMVKVTDLDGNILVPTWQPYNSFLNPNMEIQVMACDVDGDGFEEVVTATGEGGNTSSANWLVKVYSVDTGAAVLDFSFQPFTAAEDPSGEIHMACGRFF